MGKKEDLGAPETGRIDPSVIRMQIGIIEALGVEVEYTILDSVAQWSPQFAGVLGARMLQNGKESWSEERKAALVELVDSFPETQRYITLQDTDVDSPEFLYSTEVAPLHEYFIALQNTISQAVLENPQFSDDDYWEKQREVENKNELILRYIPFAVQKLITFVEEGRREIQELPYSSLENLLADLARYDLSFRSNEAKVLESLTGKIYKRDKELGLQIFTWFMGEETLIERRNSYLDSVVYYSSMATDHPDLLRPYVMEAVELHSEETNTTYALEREIHNIWTAIDDDISQEERARTAQYGFELMRELAELKKPFEEKKEQTLSYKEEKILSILKVIDPAAAVWMAYGRLRYETIDYFTYTHTEAIEVLHELLPMHPEVREEIQKDLVTAVATDFYLDSRFWHEDMQIETLLENLLIHAIEGYDFEEALKQNDSMPFGQFTNWCVTLLRLNHGLGKWYIEKSLQEHGSVRLVQAYGYPMEKYVKEKPEIGFEFGSYFLDQFLAFLDRVDPADVWENMQIRTGWFAVYKLLDLYTPQTIEEQKYYLGIAEAAIYAGHSGRLDAAQGLLEKVAEFDPEKALALVKHSLIHARYDNWTWDRMRALKAIMNSLESDMIALPSTELDEHSYLFLTIRYLYNLQEGMETNRAYTNSLADLKYFEEMKLRMIDLNSRLPEDHQLDNLDEFWAEHTVQLAKLFTLGSKIASRFIKQLAQNFGFDMVGEKLEVMDAFDFGLLQTVRSFIDSSNVLFEGDKDALFHTQILEFGMGFVGLGIVDLYEGVLADLLIEGHERKLHVSEVTNIIGDRLMSSFAQLSGFADITDVHVEDWDPRYLSKIFYAMGTFGDAAPLLRTVVKSALHREFESVLFQRAYDPAHYNPQERQLLDTIINFNTEVENTFKKLGINYKKWLHYPKTRYFSVGATHESQANGWVVFRQTLFKRISQLGGGIEVPLQKLNQNGVRLEGESVIIETELARAQRSLQQFVREVESVGHLSVEQTEVLADLKTQVFQDMTKLIRGKGQNSYGLGIRVWKRQPGRDLLQGYFTSLCIALDGVNALAMLGYLLDSSMQIVEVFDQYSGRTVGQTFVLFLTEEKKGEKGVVLIPAMDNVELHRDVVGFGDEIRKELFDYVSSYVADVLGKKVARGSLVVGDTGANDVKLDDLEKLEMQLKLLDFDKHFGSLWYSPYFEIVGGWVSRDKAHTATVRKVA